MSKSGIVILSLLATLAVGSVSCNPTIGAAPEKRTVQEQPEKPSSIGSEYSELNTAINKMNKANFTEFKKDAGTAFDEISELIPRMLPSGKKLSSSAQSNINIIENIMKKIESDKTPEQVTRSVKTGINAAISALRDINNASTYKFPNLEQKLNNIQISAKQINTKNYRHQSPTAFKQLSSTMQAVHTHYSKRQQPGK